MGSAGRQDAGIRNVLRDHRHLSKDVALLGLEADLYQSGMTSHASVNVMLALEGAFDIEFPDHMLKRNVISSIQSTTCEGELGSPQWQLRGRTAGLYLEHP